MRFRSPTWWMASSTSPCQSGAPVSRAMRPCGPHPSWESCEARRRRCCGCGSCLELSPARGRGSSTFENLPHDRKGPVEIVLGVGSREVRLEPRRDVEAVADLLVTEPDHPGLICAQRVAVVAQRTSERLEVRFEEDDPDAAVPFDPDGLTELATDRLDAFLVARSELVESIQSTRCLELVERRDTGSGGDRVAGEGSAQKHGRALARNRDVGAAEDVTSADDGA